jgi:hypothetical protein
MTRRIHLERLLNKKVRDSTGRKAGRIEEVKARVGEGGCVVEAYLLGRQGMMSRLSIAGLAQSLVSLGGTYNDPTDRAVPWHLMDLTDPRHPRLKCTLEELKAMQPRDGK